MPYLARLFSFFKLIFCIIPGQPCRRCTRYPEKHASKTIFWVDCRMTGSVTMSNGSRAIGRASTSGMPWTIWSLRDRRHRTAYAPSESDCFCPSEERREEQRLQDRKSVRMQFIRRTALPDGIGNGIVCVAFKNLMLPGRGFLVDIFDFADVRF